MARWRASQLNANFILAHAHPHAVETHSKTSSLLSLSPCFTSETFLSHPLFGSLLARISIHCILKAEETHPSFKRQTVALFSLVVDSLELLPLSTRNPFFPLAIPFREALNIKTFKTLSLIPETSHTAIQNGSDISKSREGLQIPL